MKFTDKLMKEMEEGMAKYALELEEKEKQKILDIQNGRLQRVMETIYLHLKKEKSLDKDDITYEPENFLISGEDFDFVFDLLRFYAKELDFIGQDEVDEEDDIYFEHEIGYFTYKDLTITFKIVWGQGAACWFSVATEESWCEHLSFSFDDFCHDILDFTTDENTPEKQQRTFAREMRKLKSRTEKLVHDFDSVLPTHVPATVYKKQQEVQTLLTQATKALADLSNKQNWN